MPDDDPQQYAIEKMNLRLNILTEGLAAVRSARPESSLSLGEAQAIQETFVEAIELRRLVESATERRRKERQD